VARVRDQGGHLPLPPSGTEDIYKIYAEGFRGQDQLDRIVEQAQAVVDTALGHPRQPDRTDMNIAAIAL
jgi:phosphoglucomutase